MVRTLRTVLSSACYKDLPIHSLDGAESDWNGEILQQLLSCLEIVFDVVERYFLLVKFEEVDAALVQVLLRGDCLLLDEVVVIRPNLVPIDRCLRPLLVINAN